MGYTSAAFGALGIMEAGTQISQGITAKKEYSYRANLKDYEAQMLSSQQRLEEYRYNRKAAQYAGAATAKAAKGGLNLSGSPMAVMLDTQRQIRLDQTIGWHNLEAQRQMSMADASLYRKQGSAALRSGYMNAFSTLLKAGMSASQYAKTPSIPAGGTQGSGFDVEKLRGSQQSSLPRGFMEEDLAYFAGRL